MKHIIPVALILIAIPALAATGPVAATGPTVERRVVREFVANTDSTDWTLDSGWTWIDGTLTHWPGLVGVAQQKNMPMMTAGKMYRVMLTFSQRTKGTVTISLGNVASLPYGQDGTFTLLPEVTDPQALLTITPSADFDGSISQLHVVELGHELFDKDAGAVANGWSKKGETFEHVAGSAASLEHVVGVVQGHTYRLYFGVSNAARASRHTRPGAGTGTVSLSDTAALSFAPDWNYALDVQATQDDRLVFTPNVAGRAPAPSDWGIFAVSVREITTDPVQAPVKTASGLIP